MPSPVGLRRSLSLHNSKKCPHNFYFDFLFSLHIKCNKPELHHLCNKSRFPLLLPRAYRLEKSVSARLKRASPPLLSQEDSRFLAARSLKELTILLLSSRLLFFCRNPGYIRGGGDSRGWLARVSNIPSTELIPLGGSLVCADRLLCFIRLYL